jgi:hypothetical protein
MNYLTVLGMDPQGNALDSPRTGEDGAGHWANIAYAMHVLGATYVLTEDPDNLGPCARCGAQIARYGPPCTSPVCVACHVLEWVQS